MAHPGLPGLPGLGPAAGLPVPTSASAALLTGLGLTTGPPAAPGSTAAAHSLSMLVKPEIHRGQPDDLKSNGGKSTTSLIRSRTIVSLCRMTWNRLSSIHRFVNKLKISIFCNFLTKFSCYMIIRWDIILCYSLLKDSAVCFSRLTWLFNVMNGKKKNSRVKFRSLVTFDLTIETGIKKYCLHIYDNIFQFYIITEMEKSISINMDITFRCYT